MDPDEIQTDADQPIDGNLPADPGLSQDQLAERPDLYGGADDGAGVDAPAPSRPAQPTPAQAQTIREAAALYGLDLSGQPDDHSAFVHLVQQARQARENNYYTDLGRQVAPRYKDIQGYLEQQRAKADPTPTVQPWVAPEFDERWLNLVERDQATGVFKALPGINPEFAEKVQRYADYMQRFNRDPMKMVTEAIQHHAAEVAAKVYAEQHATVERKQTINQIIDSNGSWIYQQDEHGRRYTDQNGQYLPTPEGARYVQHIRTLAQSGVKDPRLQDQIARQLVSAELYQAQDQRAQQVAATQTPQSRAAVGRPPVNPGQAVTPGRRAVVPGSTEPSVQGKSLADLLREEMAAEGITDADFSHV